MSRAGKDNVPGLPPGVDHLINSQESTILTQENTMFTVALITYRQSRPTDIHSMRAGLALIAIAFAMLAYPSRHRPAPVRRSDPRCLPRSAGWP